MNIHAKMSEQGADKAGEIFACKVGNGLQWLCILLGLAALIAVIKFW